MLQAIERDISLLTAYYFAKLIYEPNIAIYTNKEKKCNHSFRVISPQPINLPVI